MEDPNLSLRVNYSQEILERPSKAIVYGHKLYQGQKCSLEGEDDKHYFLRVEQRSIADKLKFEIRDRDDFVKTVLKQDVESVFKEKTLRPNYFK